VEILIWALHLAFRPESQSLITGERHASQRSRLRYCCIGVGEQRRSAAYDHLIACPAFLRFWTILIGARGNRGHGRDIVADDMQVFLYLICG